MLYLIVLLSTCLGAFIGKLIGMVTFYLPPILLEGCELGREPRDILRWAFQKSFCWNCKNPRALLEGIPILGYFYTKGKCNHCDFFYKRYFILEIGMGIFFGATALFSSSTASLFFVWIVISLLVCCFLTDYDYSILPDQLTQGLVWTGLIGSLFPIFLTPSEAITGASAGYGIFWMINEIFRYFRHQDGMFPGDFKLNAGVGACIGIKLLLPVLAIALLLLIAFTFAKFIRSEKRTAIGFLKKEVSYGCYLSIVASGAILFLFFW